VPAFADPLGREGVRFLLLPPLDPETLEQRVELGCPMHRHTRAPGPRVAGAEELTGDPPARPQRGPEPRPDDRETLGRHEEQGEARDQEVGRRWNRVLDPLGPEQQARGGRRRYAAGERSERLGPPVERDDAPAALEERDRVAADAAAEIDGEARRATLGREPLEGQEYGRARWATAGDPVVGRELRSIRHGAAAPTRR